MKIRLALAGIHKPEALGDWPQTTPSCPADFRGGNGDRHDLWLGRGRPVFEKAKGILMAYAMFPPHRLQALLSSGSRLENGATVVQHVKFACFEIEIANRIVAVMDREDTGIREAGFTLVSLNGHAEQGTETFMVSLNAAGEVGFQVIAWSRPGHWITRFFARWTRATQLKAIRECLAWMRQECAS